MSRRLIIRPEAEEDIYDAAAWYNDRAVDLGGELLDEIRAALDRVLENPLANPLLRKQPEVRRILTRRFPYRIFYAVRSDAVIVFAVVHAGRHEREWKKRL